MTIIVGMSDPTGITVCTDSIYTWGEEFTKAQGHKFVELPEGYSDKAIVASSGQEKFSQIFERVVKESPKLLDFTDRYGLMRLSSKLFTEAGKVGIGNAEDNNLPEHDLGFLIATKSTRKLWTIDSDYSVGEHDSYICIGSGYVIAESVLKTLTSPDLNMHWSSQGRPTSPRMARIAVEITGSLHPYCGGTPFLQRITYD